MKKILLLLVILFAVWLALNRERIYLHDFFAKIEVAGTRDTHRSVYINASNDLLLISDDRPPALELVRPSGAAPVLAGSLNCIYGIACLARRIDASALAATPVIPDAQVVKGVRIITFKDGDGHPAAVHLW
jgi:hypothetical protein